MSDIDYKKYLEILLAQQKELEKTLENTANDSRPVELDQSAQGRLSRMDAMQMQAMAVETKFRRKTELQRIRKALQLIDEGEYGYCFQCGERIPEPRLSINPSNITCIACAS